ncbi:hypothetical protein GQ53DRAFT_405369 [Thozetella sp. PMI_491]|nr:hypothetical protein GQ53DRAFT_405369 [Thozetella sp. PMI_491]
MARITRKRSLSPDLGSSPIRVGRPAKALRAPTPGAHRRRGDPYSLASFLQDLSPPVGKKARPEKRNTAKNNNAPATPSKLSRVSAAELAIAATPAKERNDEGAAKPDAEKEEPQYAIIYLMGHRQTWRIDDGSGCFEMRVKWADGDEDWVFEDTLAKDVPEMVWTYWAATGGRKQAAKDAKVKDRMDGIAGHSGANGKRRFLVHDIGYPPLPDFGYWVSEKKLSKAVLDEYWAETWRVRDLTPR